LQGGALVCTVRGMSASYHKGNVHADMVREGLLLLASEGLEAVTLRRLAREIGIAPSSIYNHFANRRTLLATLAEEGFRRLLNLEKQAYDSTPDFQDSVKAAAREYLLFANRNQHLYRLMFSWEISAADDFPDLAKAGYDFINENVLRWYGEPYDTSKKFVSDYQAVMLVWASIHGLALLVIQQSFQLEGRDEPSLIKLVDEFEDNLFSALKAAQAKGVS
jgi:AcrR family transcriptional regulator